MKDNNSIKESVEFDSLVGKKDESKKSSSFVDIMEYTSEEKEKLLNDDIEWKKYWKGMPDFEQEDNSTYKTLYVHFRNENDYLEFSKLINQNLTQKTKSIWYPKLDRTKNSLLRWIETEDND